MIAKLESLPPEKQAEVEQFVDSLVKEEKPQETLLKRKFGCGKGMFIMHDDFDEPLDDFKEYITA